MLFDSYIHLSASLSNTARLVVLQNTAFFSYYYFFTSFYNIDGPSGGSVGKDQDKFPEQFVNYLAGWSLVRDGYVFKLLIFFVNSFQIFVFIVIT